jgi:hypothetical protein
MRSSLKDANARRMQAAQAKAVQEKAASTSEWNASKATNKQPVNAIEIDDDEPVVQGKGRKKRLWRWVEDDNNDEERKKERLERIAKTNEMWDALRIKKKEGEERRKKEREGRKTEK